MLSVDYRLDAYLKYIGVDLVLYAQVTILDVVVHVLDGKCIARQIRTQRLPNDVSHALIPQGHVHMAERPVDMKRVWVETHDADVAVVAAEKQRTDRRIGAGDFRRNAVLFVLLLVHFNDDHTRSPIAEDKVEPRAL